MIKAIIFDVDDTLLMTRETKFAAHKHLAKTKYNFDLSDADISLYWGQPFKTLMLQLYGKFDSLDNIIQEYYAIRDAFPNKAYPDTYSTILALTQKYPIGALSSAARNLVLSSLTQAGLELSRFFYIQTEDDTQSHKPNPEVFEPMLKQLHERQIHPGESVYVGDSLLDYSAAHDAGLEFYGVAGRTTSRDDFENAGAKTISSLSELLQLI